MGVSCPAFYSTLKCLSPKDCEAACDTVSSDCAKKKKPDARPGFWLLMIGWFSRTSPRLEPPADSTGDAQVVLQLAATACGFGEVGHQIVDRPETNRHVPLKRNVQSSPKRHREGIARARDAEACAIGMGAAKQLLSERSNAAEMVEVEPRPEHVSHQVRIDVRAADLADVIVAEFTCQSVPAPRVQGKRGGASVCVEGRKAAGSGIGTNVGVLEGNILRSAFLREDRQACENEEPHEVREFAHKDNLPPLLLVFWIAWTVGCEMSKLAGQGPDMKTTPPFNSMPGGLGELLCNLTFNLFNSWR